MKMITAIIQKKDATQICDALKEANFSFTKMATTGGFLQAGNVTLMIGTADEKVDLAIDLIRKHCAKRRIPVTSTMGTSVHAMGYYQTEVSVGGAIIFVAPIERFEKM